MTTLALLGFAIVMLCTMMVIPASARTDWHQTAPHWIDQTIYQPNCFSAICPCDCRPGSLCLPDCVGW
jgi:ectoine hydroxylase-related dioxygenase (phytanoyl-CoA dioxygenase family)